MPIVVVSAMSGVTNRLFRLADLAILGSSWQGDFTALADHHKAALRDLGLETTLLDSLLEELEGLIRGIALIRDCTLRTKDYARRGGFLPPWRRQRRRPGRHLRRRPHARPPLPRRRELPGARAQRLRRRPERGRSCLRLELFVPLKGGGARRGDCKASHGSIE